MFATGWVLCLGLSAQAEPATPAGKQPTADFHVAASGVRGEEKMTPKDVYAPIDIQQIKMGGELGRRMDITVSNNLLKIDMDKIFLAPFRGGPN
ncbi:MAG: hypothetical protein ACOYOU_19040, partial [Kiritimatiellia bacterium]